MDINSVSNIQTSVFVDSSKVQKAPETQKPKVTEAPAGDKKSVPDNSQQGIFLEPSVKAADKPSAGSGTYASNGFMAQENASTGSQGQTSIDHYV